MIKWFFFNVHVARRIRKVKDQFDKVSADDYDKYTNCIDRTTVATTADGTRRRTFINYWNQQSHTKTVSLYEVNFDQADSVVKLLTPRAYEEADRITFWLLQWPIVIIALFFNDLLLKLGRTVANVFDYTFTYMSRAAVARATKGL